MIERLKLFFAAAALAVSMSVAMPDALSMAPL